MKPVCVLAACVLWSSSFFVAFAQTANEPAAAKVKFDESSRIKLSGVVDDIEQRSLGGNCKAPEVFVIVKVNAQSFALQVGPKWFVDELAWTFNKGDKLEITGWKIGKEDSNEVLVRKITRGEWSLEPRDDTGAANWLWMTAPKDSGKCS
ncbi:MAG TPA: hypothetical protein VJR04_14270 [Terriglobales bacterium]|nr:hypothetical protein [Terriglobales bacterium]